MTLILNSGNPGKVSEMRALLGSLEIARAECEENGSTFAENARIKALALVQKFREGLLLGEDSGISLPDLGGYPGIYSARAWNVDPGFSQAKFEEKPENVDDFNNQKLLRILQERRLFEVYPEGVPAYYHCAISVVSPSGEELFSCSGTAPVYVVNEEHKESGFGYDWIARHELGHLGKMPSVKKNQISHRAAAVRALKLFLASQ